MSKKLNTNSNVYIIAYAAVMVIIVAFLLAFVSKALQKQSDANVAIDKKSQILAALNIRNIEDSEVEAQYAKVVVCDKIVDAEGNVIDAGTDKDQAAFKMSSKDIEDNKLPLYECKIGNQTKYVVPVYGMGLWGGLWGYVALNEDCNTIYGTYFSHESETAGLGALISEQKFQDLFKNKEIRDDAGNVLISVEKAGKKVEGLADINRCDAITGATLTSNGVSDMLKTSLGKYQGVFSSIAGDMICTCPPADCEEAAEACPDAAKEACGKTECPKTSKP